MNIWTFLLVGAGAIQAIGLFAFLLGMFRAPDGFQDNAGFHPDRETAIPATTSAMVELPAVRYNESSGHAA